MNKLTSTILVGALASSISVMAFAEEADEWGDDDWGEEKAWTVSQKLSYGYAGQQPDSINRNSAMMNELRYQLDYDYQGEANSFDLTIEGLVDDVRSDEDLLVREASWYYAGSSSFDLRVGRQIVTWGTGDFLFLNDTFAKDWQSFFNGREDDYLKRPIDAIRLGFYSDSVNLDLVYQPDFTADKFLNGEAYSFYLPGNGLIQPEPFSAVKPHQDAINLRLYRNFGSVELAAYLSDGYYTSPSSVTAQFEPTFSARRTIGASLRLPLGGGLFNAEWANWESRADQSGTDPLTTNSKQLFLMGYEKEIVSNLTWGVQGYLEKTKDYAALLANQPVGVPFNKENRTIITNRLTWLTLQQRLVNSFFVFYSPSDKDYYLRYSSLYKMTDKMHWAVGINFINGDSESTFFSQLQDNSNLFVRFSYYF